MSKIAQMSSSFVQWWTNDQTFFNEVVHRARTISISPKSKLHRERLEAHELLNRSTHQPALLARTMRRIASVVGGAGDGGAVAQMRGVIFKEMSGTGISIATFPYIHFASGHTYFTQSLQQHLK